MNTAIHHLTHNDMSVWTDSTQPLLIITQDTLESIRNFQQAHPTIDPDFFSKELNLTIKELLFRMDRESRGES